MYHMSVQEKYYNLLKIGVKTVELRLYDEKRQKIQVGDVIEFANGLDKNDTFKAVVMVLYKASNFEELCREKIVPVQGGFESQSELIEILAEFYTPEQQEKYGVIGIEIQVL